MMMATVTTKKTIMSEMRIQLSPSSLLSCHSRNPAPPTVNKHFTATRTSAFSSATFSSSSWSSSSDDRYNNMLYEKRIRIRKKGKTTTTSIQQAQAQAQAQVPSHQPQRYYQQLIRRSFVHQSDTSDNNNNNNSEDHQDSVVDVDFFKLFDIPRKFGTSLPLLKNQYLKLMIEYHPDKQQHQQQQDSNNDSASITAETITNAYQILQLPHTRANHLLELYNCPLMEYDNTNNNNNNSDNNNNNDNNNDNNNNDDMSQFAGMDFLMDMMEYRERIEDLVDASSNNKQDEFRTISKETKVLQNQCEELLKDLLDNNNNDDNDNNNNNNIVLLLDDDNKLQEARKLTAQLQYWYRLECTLKEEMDI